MPKIDVRPLKDYTNDQILNAIRKNATDDYQRRIPEATKASLQDNLQRLTNNRPLWNEFIGSLINRIGLVMVRNTMWTNKLAKFKRGMLQYGDTIEEINIGLIQAKTYDPDRDALERELFGQHESDVQTSFHKINRQDYYPLTVNEPLLQRAFLDNEALMPFIADLMSAPITSDNWDEFLLTTALFAEYYKAGGFFKVQVEDVTDLDSDAPAARGLLRRIRAMSGTLQFISTAYNASGMPVAVNADELELFITPEANAALDVEALAAMFNVDRGNVDVRITLVPKEHFNIPGVQAILTTRDFFVIADNKLETTSQQNAVTLSTNYFLHHWQIISASRFVPAILFTTEAGDEINIIETPVVSVSAVTVHDEDGVGVTDVVRGESYQIVAHAVTDPANGVNDGVRLELTGNIDSRSRVSQTGVLKVAASEESETLTVNAYATDTEPPQLLNTVTVDVVGDLLVLWPNAQVIPDSDSDGKLEVTPEAPSFDDATNTVTIPNVIGVKYQKVGVDVANGSTHVVTVSTVFTAVPRASKYELTSGATASWTFAP